MSDGIVNDTMITASMFHRMPEPQKAEIAAYVDELIGFHDPVTTIEYDVIDCPMLKIVAFVKDENGYVIADEDGEISRRTHDVALRRPPPAWWQPELRTEPA